MRVVKTRSVYRKRKHRIEFLKSRLLRKSWPRLHASIILLLTGLAGFLASFTLLHIGVTSMWLRYPVSILFAYGVFLILLRVWLSLSRPRDWDFDFDALELLDETSFESTTEWSGPHNFGGGGDFAGGGGGGGWEGDVSSLELTQSVSTVTPTNGGSSAGFFDLDLEEGWLIVIAIIALIAGVIAAFYVVYIAPALLAEILLDGVLMAGLYKRVKSIKRRHWLLGALRQTAVAATLVVVFFTIAGFAMQKAVPKARSIGEVWKYMGDR